MLVPCSSRVHLIYRRRGAAEGSRSRVAYKEARISDRRITDFRERLNRFSLVGHPNGFARASAQPTHLRPDYERGRPKGRRYRCGGHTQLAHIAGSHPFRWHLPTDASASLDGCTSRTNAQLLKGARLSTLSGRLLRQVHQGECAHAPVAAKHLQAEP